MSFHLRRCNVRQVVYDSKAGSKSRFAPHSKMINCQQKVFVLHKKDRDSMKSISNYFPYIKGCNKYFVFSRNDYFVNENVITVR
jgi:hypothetical protein